MVWIARFDLQRHVADTEAHLQVVPGARQQAVVEDGAGTHQMGGHRDFGRAHRPDVQIVHVGDTRQPGKISIDLAVIDMRRYGIERQSEGGSLSSDQVPTVMTTAMTMLTAGSSHNRPSP